MSDIDEVAGIIDAIDTEATAHDPIEEVSTTPVAEGADSTPEPEEAEKTNTQKPVEVETTEEAAPERGEAPAEADATETTEPSQEQKTEVAEIDWKANVPPPPAPYQGPEPEYDHETGQITNMTPAEYSQYMRETAKAEFRQENYINHVENVALSAAEQVLPELKTNPAIRQMVENARIASIINGQQIDAYQAAKLVREAMGIGPQQIAQAKAEATKNAKASITVQKNAALETGSARTPDADSSLELVKRVKRGDDDAFAELLGEWEKTGII